MSMDATALPSELLVTPQPLIGFCGLDVNQNIVHKTVWDAFSSNRKAERASVQFKLLPPSYDFPVAKPKRLSYEWYQPKGILKRNWMLKHLHVLPAVVVLFQDLEWNDPQWSEKQLQCVSTMQSLRNALQERNTRLCLVLLQKAAPLPPGEDLLASERAVSLATACALNSKHLFILPHTEHLMGYTLRLESAFLDLAQSYYAQMAKRIRTHRDQLTAAHVTLKIRHQFKLGFVAEMRQDYSTGLKHYTQAYAILEEIRTTDVNYFEIKTIGGFLNYKICRLMFKLKVPRDAINHFISHIEKYKNRVGYKDLIFEHYGWLSTQHSHFAELFCDAIKNGLPALQTQHPGIYYHKAAEYIIKRRDAFQQNYAMLSPTEPTTPTGFQNNNSLTLYTEFFGVRAGKAGEPISEQQINTVVRDNEKAFNFSGTIINLLSQAMSQFKLYKCLRFRKKLAIDMAEEYYKSGDHAKALTLYSLMLPDFRQDNWHSLFSDVLLKTLRCALISASITDFVSCSLEALSLKIRSGQKERIVVLENLWKVFQCVPPLPQHQIAPEIRDLWDNALASVKSPLSINLDKMYDLIEMHATFDKSELKNDEQVVAHIILRLLTDVPIKLHNFALLLTDGNSLFRLQTPKYATCSNLLDLSAILKNPHDDMKTNSTAMPRVKYNFIDNDLILEPDLYYHLIFTAEATQFMENAQLRVARFEALMGTEKLSALLLKHATYKRNPFRHFNKRFELEDNITTQPICYIAPTFHLVTQSNFVFKEMLVNEYFPIVTTINNSYNVFLQNIGINVTVPPSLRNKVFLTTDVTPGRQKLHSQIQIDIGELSMQASNTISYYVFSLIACEVTLQQKVWYTLDVLRPKASNASIAVVAAAENSTPNSADNSPDNVRSLISEIGAVPTPIYSPVQIENIEENRIRKTREDTLRIQCNSEFHFTGQFYTLNKKPLTKAYRGENFLLRINAEVQSECDLDVLESYFICDHNLVQSVYNFKRKKYTNQYGRGEKLEDVITLRTDSTLENWVTSKSFDRNNLENRRPSIFAQIFQQESRNEASNQLVGSAASSSPAIVGVNKNLMTKSLTNLSASGNNSSISSMDNMSSSMVNSQTSDDGKLMNSQRPESMEMENTAKLPNSRLIYNKTMEAVQATSHCRGFFKTSFYTVDSNQQTLSTQNQGQGSKHRKPPIFGVYCIKWRRTGSKEENESKFMIDGLEIEIPPLNVYCAIEEKMFVKMPMTFKIVLKNPTTKVLHLIATLNISNTDNFICSGHRQLDVSVFAHGEKELVYNLYPLRVGWQDLPELLLEYNTQADPSRDESQNSLLSELMQRSIPKWVYVLPPLKQQSK